MIKEYDVQLPGKQKPGTAYKDIVEFLNSESTVAEIDTTVQNVNKCCAAYNSAIRYYELGNLVAAVRRQGRAFLVRKEFVDHA